VTVLLPQGGEAKWGAVEAVIPKHIADAAAKAKVGGATHHDDGELSPGMDE
jgi:hypothetical protein